MANYNSVINTAKNNRLIRAEIRELVLAAGLYWGMGNDLEKAKKLYPGYEHRQTQYTEINIVCHYDTHPLVRMIHDVIKSYFPYRADFLQKEPYLPNAELITIFDTKKLRIYRQRLEYEKNHEWNIRKSTTQYLWTAAPLAYWYYLLADPYIPSLDFSDAYFVLKGKNKISNLQQIADYIQNVCGIRCIYSPEKNSTKLYFKAEEWDNLKKLADKEYSRLKDKFIAGGYISADYYK